MTRKDTGANQSRRAALVSAVSNAMTHLPMFVKLALQYGPGVADSLERQASALERIAATLEGKSNEREV